MGDLLILPSRITLNGGSGDSFTRRASQHIRHRHSPQSVAPSHAEKPSGPGKLTSERLATPLLPRVIQERYRLPHCAKSPRTYSDRLDTLLRNPGSRAAGSFNHPLFPTNSFTSGAQ